MLNIGVGFCIDVGPIGVIVMCRLRCGVGVSVCLIIGMLKHWLMLVLVSVSMLVGLVLVLYRSWCYSHGLTGTERSA